MMRLSFLEERYEAFNKIYQNQTQVMSKATVRW